MEKIKVMIAEDMKMFRDMLSEGLRVENIDLIGVAENGKVLIELVKLNLPDIVLLDLRMPEMDGEAVLKVFSKDFPGIKTIILSDNCTDYYIANVIINGAAAYLRKDSPFSEVIKAIEYVYKNGVYFNEVISEEILDQFRSEKRITYIIENAKFSKREIQILIEVCKNKQIKQIAADLGISQGTVKYHKGQLFEKTESEATVDLVLFAIRQGIFNPEDKNVKKKR